MPDTPASEGAKPNGPGFVCVPLTRVKVPAYQGEANPKFPHGIRIGGVKQDVFPAEEAMSPVSDPESDKKK